MLFARRHASTCSTSAPSPTTSSSAPTRSGTTTSLRVSYTSLTTPRVGLRRRRRRPASARCASRRRRRTSTSTATSSTRTWATAPDGTRGAGRRRAPRRHAARRHRAGVVYGYGSYECVDPAVLLASARLSLLDRGVVWALVHPRGGGELGRALVPRRQAAAQAQHVHRHDRRAPSTSSAEGFADAPVACPAPLTSAEPFAGHLVLHEWSAAQPKVWVLFHDGTEHVLDFGAEPHDIELGGNPQWDTTALRLSYQSLTTPAVDLRRRRRVGRADAAQADTDARASTSTATCRTRTWATAPDGTAVPIDVVRHVDTPVDGTAPAVDLRLRLLRVLDAAVVLRRPALAARPWRRVGAGPPPRRRRARARLVARRPAAAQAQHVHRHDRRAPTTSSPRAAPTATASPSAAAAPAACSSARASRCARTCSAPPSPRSRSSTS